MPEHPISVAGYAPRLASDLQALTRNIPHSRQRHDSSLARGRCRGCHFAIASRKKEAEMVKRYIVSLTWLVVAALVALITTMNV